MNIKARYYSEVGSYFGAIKLYGKWFGAKNLNYLDKTKWIRWQGPPSDPIKRAMKNTFIIDCKEDKWTERFLLTSRQKP